MKLAGHILLLLSLCLSLAACGGREGKVIPEKKMAMLYADMFLADQWLKENKPARQVADTTLFFDPIFEKYGYTFADYEKSIEYYSGETEVLSRIVDSASAMLKRQADRYTKISAAISKVREENEKNRVPYLFVDFTRDSAVWAASGVLWPVKDSTASDRDTLPARRELLFVPEFEPAVKGRPLQRGDKTLLERVEMKEIELR